MFNPIFEEKMLCYAQTHFPMSILELAYLTPKTGNKNLVNKRFSEQKNPHNVCYSREKRFSCSYSSAFVMLWTNSYSEIRSKGDLLLPYTKDLCGFLSKYD